MRKKLYAVLLILAASAACLFAISLDAEARGNAVLTSGDVSYAFSHNPAFLASSGFSLMTLWRTFQISHPWMRRGWSAAYSTC